MRSPILAAAAVVLTPIIFALSLFLLYRGHNLPGGGFIGGLTASGAILLHAFGCGADASRKLLARPDGLMVLGLFLGGVAGFPPLLLGQDFFTGVWAPVFTVPVLGAVHLGTFLIFDVGVYLAVIGFVIHSARSLDEDFDDAASIGDASAGGRR